MNKSTKKQYFFSLLDEDFKRNKWPYKLMHIHYEAYNITYEEIVEYIKNKELFYIKDKDCINISQSINDIVKEL